MGRTRSRSLNGPLEWDYTQRLDVIEISLNQPWEPKPSDMFPLSYQWVDGKTCLWDPIGINNMVVRQKRPFPEPDSFGKQVVEHTADLEAWMMQVPKT